MQTKDLALDPTTKKNIDQWLNGEYDEETKKAIREMLAERPSEAIDAFYTQLSFGTGGLRGIMGVGTNRMNPYTVRAATQGLANYLATQPPIQDRHAVFIGYDSRNNSKLFAEESAKVLAGNGMKVYLCKDLRPTPLVSFGCRIKKCSAAIMITASHNPPAYNGYKVYWNDGAQVLPPHDQGIIKEVERITDPGMVKKVNSVNDPLIEMVDDKLDDEYLKAIFPLQNYPKQNQEYGKQLKVVYTSLHGAGITLVPKALANWGFANLFFVENQIVPDGNFPTVKSPNPEERSALSLGIERLKETNGDILIATDPDTDRVGIAVQHQGEIHLLNGNQVASICLEHICEALTSQNLMPSKAVFVKTIGTTELFQKICDRYKKPCVNVLTGFKYIAEKIREWEQDPSQGWRYIFGGEESYGYLLGTVVRDKDAVSTSALICEVALAAKRKGKTIVDLLQDLYHKYGVFVEKLLSVNFEETKAGKEQMAKGMALLDQSPPTSIDGTPVLVIEDYKRSIKRNLQTNEKTPITLPVSDVLLFWLEDGTKLMIRPSGTEPKIKIYCGVQEKKFSSLPSAIMDANEKADRLMKALKNLLQG
jgi:phosphoglucomutase/phosphomannomutase